MRTKPYVLIGTVVAPTHFGGLASYSRTLAEELRHGCEIQVRFGCVDSVHPGLPGALTLSDPIHSLCNPRRWHFLHRTIFSRMASRQFLHPLLDWTLQTAVPHSRLKSALSTPGVIHFVGTGWDFLGLRLLQYARRVGARFTVLPAIHPESWGSDVIDLLLYRRADAVFCLSDHEAAYLLKRGVSSNQLVRCGIPPVCKLDGNAARFRQAQALGCRPVVLFMGRRDEGKGYPALLKAWPLVLESIPTAVLLLGGPGGAEFEALRVNLPRDSIRDLGAPDERAKADALAACDVFCLPSAHESFGIVYLEAWSYGKPVVCGTAAASRELVESDRTGLWADQQPQTIARQLTVVLGEPAQARRMGQAGLALQQAKYTRNAMLRAHLEAWQMGPTHY